MPSSDYKKAFSENNLYKAWGWLLKNREYRYKNFFRNTYSAYALASSENIKNLSNRILKTKSYQAHNSCKIYLLKPTGLLRKISLLTIEDQIVYQAIINIIAEKHYSKNQKNLYLKSFGYIYDTNNKKFFYDKWEYGYKKFNDKIKELYFNDLEYLASFDLASYYDAIDHKVIKHFLINELKVHADLVYLLIQLLEKWSSCDKKILHGHGIPQGPMSSGLLSEIILSHFDNSFNEIDNKKDDKKSKYIRYVDDIRVLTNKEELIRQSIVDLDLLSKQVGLFPQGNKINLHKIKDINSEIKEIKSIDNLDYYFFYNDSEKQEKLRERLKSITPRNKIINESLFKYLIAQLKPTSEMDSKLIKILDNYPHLYECIANYIEKNILFNRKLSKENSLKIFNIIERQNYLYPSKIATLLKSLKNTVHIDLKPKFDAYCKTLWVNRENINKKYDFKYFTVDLEAALFSWLIEINYFKFNNIEEIFKQKNEEWWFIKEIIENIDVNSYGKPSLSSLIHIALNNKNNDIALNACLKTLNDNISINYSQEMNYLAQLYLKKSCVISKTTNYCNFTTLLNGLFSNNQLKFKLWTKLFQRRKEHYDKAIHQISLLINYYNVDYTAFALNLDAINELILFQIHQYDSSLSGTQANLGGIIGGLMSKPANSFKYPIFLKFCQEVRKLRYIADLAHPKMKNKQKLTRRIKHNEVHAAHFTNLFFNAYKEINDIL